jgi:hypothetical protein
MERLKKLEDICQPDERNQNRVDIDHSTGAVTQTSIESIYAVVEGIRLNDKVPDDVRSCFEVARNLALYSWFVYSFQEVAAMQALAALEMAARNKTGEDKTAFKNLLDKLFQGRQFAPELSLAKAVSNFRNEFAHGSIMRSGQGLFFVRMCSEWINELFS